MSNIILKPKMPDCAKDMVGIRLNEYDEKKTFTSFTERIYLKNCNLKKANEIIKSALMNSKMIDENFDVEE